MTIPEFDPNRPPNPITLEFLAGCIIGLNGRMDGFGARLDSLEARVANVEAGQRQIMTALLTIGGAFIATLAGGMIAGVFALLTRMG